ncbi:hypothetical protein FHS79_002019 [Polymorphobacter multimanifer]|uniref:HPF/RaiA family ribosome-associated protein n=1 Tax=Polymorphobacter multimanifer TaxID=1070431 RepID=A0A841LFV0_9SPHN|nr:HPF/RaiA family ribosome-associated protein [Polymorphobacter multimanifer]MBB6227838.1 hypothetical protein [Polymorphobacter multimanifer]
MQIQINSDNIIKADAGTIEAMDRILRDRLGRFETRLTRVEAHLKDVNGTSAGAPDTVCTLEARPNGLDPLTVDGNGATVDLAVASAANKMITALDRTFGKLTNRKGH